MITGASSGIGEASALIFARQKSNLFLVARREERLKVLAKRLEKEFGVQTKVVKLDVSDAKAVGAFSKKHENALKKVDVLVNSAGLALGLSKFQDSKLSDMSTMIDTNIKGLFAVTHALLPHFISKNSGHVVNLGSVAGRWTYPNGHVYSATKHAVHAFSQALRMDLLGTGIRVTEISPGMVNTEFSTVRLGDTKKADAVYAGMTPLTADDIAEAIWWSVNRPKHVNIQEVVLYPTDQASPTQVNRHS